MTVFRNVMVYLGLGPDEEYEDGYLYDDGDRGDVDAPDPSGGGLSRSESSLFAHEGEDEQQHNVVGAHDIEPSVAGPDDDLSPSAVGAVRPLRPVADPEDEVLDLADHERRAPDPFAEPPREGRTFSGGTRVEPVVRAVPIQRSKPKTISPDNFGDAKTIGDEFKNGTPVVMNLQGLDRELARRLIDFASGVCYSLSGSMEKIASQVFLLTPKSVDVTDEERRRIEERGFDR